MAKTVQINISTDTQKAVKSLGDLEAVTSKTLKTMSEMEEESERLTKALKGVEVGTKEYKELRKELIKVNTEIKNQELAMEALDNEQVASELKSVAGGFVDMAGGLALVGTHNKSLEQVVKTMAMVEGATKIVTGAIESYQSITKLAGTFTAIYSKAITVLSNSQVLAAAKTKILTVAQTILNAVMTANPIGIIVVAIGAFIAGIVALIMNIKKVIVWLKSMAKYLLLLLGPIGAIILAFTNMGKAQEETAKQSTIATATKLKNLDEEIKKNQELLAQMRKQTDEIIQIYKNQIAMQEALGKSSDELKANSLRDIFQRREAEAQLYNEVVRNALERFNIEKGTNFTSLQDAINTYKEKLKAATGVSKEIIKLELDRLTQLQEAQKRNNQQTFDAEVEYRKNLTEERKKAHDAYMKQLEERKKAEQDLIDRSTDAWTKYEENRINNMDDSLEKELQLRQFQFEQYIANLDDNIEAEKALRLQAEEKLQEDLSYIEYKWEKKNAKQVLQIQQKSVADMKLSYTEGIYDIDKTWKQKVGEWQTKNAELIKTIQESFAVASEAIAGIMSAAQDIMNLQAEEATARREEQYSKESEALKAQLANREISEQQYNDKLALLEQKKKNEERQAARKAFQMDKAMRLSQAVMGTAQAVISGLSAPFPLGVIQAGINAALGAVQVGIISAQKFRAARGGVVPGSPSNVDTVDAKLAQGEAVINSTSTQMFAPLLSAINEAGGGIPLVPNVSMPKSSQPVFQQNQTQTVKAYVVESEMSESQKKVSRLERSASFK